VSISLNGAPGVFFEHRDRGDVACRIDLKSRQDLSEEFDLLRGIGVVEKLRRLNRVGAASDELMADLERPGRCVGNWKHPVSETMAQ